MHRTTVSIAALLIATLIFAQPSPAGPLTEAQVTKILNRVSLVDPHSGDRPAVVRDVVKDDLGIETGAKSRSELLFQDNTLTRLGAETFFSFKTGTRDLTLEKGAMLLQVPKGLGGAKIHTAAVTAAITGTTIMMEYIPTKYIKVMVLEGSLRLSRNGLFGDSVVLTAGKMVIMRPDAKNIPDPVDVDLQHVVQSSTLVNFPGAEPLPSMPLIQAAIEQQQKQLAANNLVPTNLVMGQGTNVIVATNDQLARLTGSTGLFGATLQKSPVTAVTNGALPIVTNAGTAVTSTLGSTVGTVNTLLDSTTGALSGTTTNLLATTTGAVTSIPISSTTQVTSLLDSAVPTVTGTVAVVPSTTNTTVAAVSGIVTGTTSVATTATPTTSGVVSAITTSPTSTTTSPSSVITSTTATPVTTVASTATTTTTSVTGLLGHH
jgi:hypothetical protein